jgi:hypothetical protein
VLGVPPATDAIRDDRVLGGTRALSLFIAPFLVVAFVLLYLFPADTQRLFAWTITPTMTPMMLASAYLGGAYFFIRAASAHRWSSIKAGFPPVVVFAALLAVATVLHWDRFNHTHPAFWVWVFLYAVAPFLVAWAWLANRRYTAPPATDAERIGPATRTLAAVVGAALAVWGSVMFLAPALVIPIWPWTLTPLTCRVVGAIFCLGVAGIWVAADPRWLSVNLILHVQVIMVASILLAMARAWPQMSTDKPVLWVILGGAVAVLVASAVLSWHHRTAPSPGQPAPAASRRPPPTGRF